MRNRTERERFEQDPARRRLLKQEQLILDVSERISALLDAAEMSKADLARALGKSKAFVTQILAGDRNLTLRTLSDIADAIGANAEFAMSIRDSFLVTDEEPETSTTRIAIFIGGSGTEAAATCTELTRIQDWTQYAEANSEQKPH